MKRALRIGLIASSRFPIAQPFVGGLEAHIWVLARTLSARGHEVTLFAAPGSDRSVAHRFISFSDIDGGDGERRDISESRALMDAEDVAYRRVMARLIREGSTRLDVVHNHSLHPSPLAAVRRLGVPMISTFHTPPLPRLVEALSGEQAEHLCLVAVSRHAARSWSMVADEVHVVHNGVDTNDWPAGPGGPRLVWFGRFVPEKGAELAIAAARLVGRPLDLAGPIVDERYYRAEIEPHLGPDVRYLGHLTQGELAQVVGRAKVALVTPRWDEPYGLVVAEALACGTPVAAFARGGIPEIIDARCGRLAAADDVDGLAAAVTAAAGLDRRAVRRHAERHCSITRMVSAYEDIYRSHIHDRVTARVPGVSVMRHAHGTVAQHLHDSVPYLHDSVAMHLHDSVPHLHDSVPHLHDSVPHLHDSVPHLHDSVPHLHDSVSMHDSVPMQARDSPANGSRGLSLGSS